MAPINLTIHYFALLREQRGLAVETVQTTSNQADLLYRELAANHGLTLPLASLKVAINDEFATWTTALKEGDDVVFLPPMAGG